MAAGDQYQRELNAEQTKDRMRSRALNGYWPFQAPVGYRHANVRGHKGKVLVRDEPIASVVQEALEGYASGRFAIKAEVKRFLEQYPTFPRNSYGGVSNQWVNQILHNPIYAGYVEAPKWGIALRQGHHAPLVSLETHQRILSRSEEASYAPARADLNLDFALRGAVACAECGKALTGYWSSPREGRRYAYYMCFNRECSRCRKSIKRDRVEADFVSVLESMTPARRLVDLAGRLFKDAWQKRLDESAAFAKTCVAEIGKLQKQIDALLDRLVEVNSPTLIATYENRVSELEKQKLLLKERSETRSGPVATFEEMFEQAISFLANPAKLWKTGDFQQRQLVLKLTFAEKLRYCLESGFRTPETSFPFKMLEALDGGQKKMAHP